MVAAPVAGPASGRVAVAQEPHEHGDARVSLVCLLVFDTAIA